MEDSSTTAIKTPCFSYEAIIQKNGLTPEFREIEVTLPSLHGDNFGSSCDYLTIHLNSGEKIELFVKKKSENPGLHELIQRLRLFEKEAGFFNILIPKILRFLEDKTSTRGRNYNFNMVPRPLFANDQIVMMENLTQRGYKVLNKVERQDVVHAIFVMKTLAKFHAPTYLLIKEELRTGGGTIQDFVRQSPYLEDAMLVDGEDNKFGNWINMSVQVAANILKSVTSRETEYALRVLKRWTPNAVPKIQKYVRLEKDHVCDVINHGDCWNNNMMFSINRRPGEKAPHLMLLDFQLIRVGSPTIDLSYYMFTSLKHGVRQGWWEKLLGIYFHALHRNVELLGGSLDFSFQELKMDFRRNFVSGFILGVCFSASFEAYEELGNLDQIDGDVMTHIGLVIQKWVLKNPEKTTVIANQLCGMFQEYKILREGEK